MSKNFAFTDHQDRLLNIYLKDVRKYQPLSAGKEQALLCRAQKGDLQARDMLVLTNMRYVIRVAKEYNNYHDNTNDLIEDGIIGMMEAIKTFDLGKRCRLITYADDYIRKGIRDGLALYNHPVHVPDRVDREIHKQYDRDLEADVYYGHDLSDYESYDDHTVTSLDMRLSEDSNLTIADVLVTDDNEATDRACEHDSLMNLIMATLGSMPDRQAQATRMFLGLDCDFECAPETIATYLGVSRSRANQLCNLGLERLRQVLTEQGYNSKSNNYAA